MAAAPCVLNKEAVLREENTRPKEGPKDHALGEQLGAAYVARNFRPRSRRRAVWDAITRDALGVACGGGGPQRGRRCDNKWCGRFGGTSARGLCGVTTRTLDEDGLGQCRPVVRNIDSLSFPGIPMATDCEPRLNRVFRCISGTLLGSGLVKYLVINRNLWEE